LGKCVLLGDLHFGINNFNIQKLDSQIEFFKQQLIPYLKQNNINTIYQLGDFFDNRVSQNNLFFQYLCEELLDYIRDANIKLYVIVGNHDLALRNSLDYSMLYIIDRMYDNIVVIREPTELDILGNKVICYPWITKGNELNMNQLKQYDYVFGHFEIQDFLITKNQISTHGIDKGVFTLNKKIFSGHYHIRSSKINIEYIGVPYQLNWNDYNCKNGFYVLDDNMEYEFVENIISPKHIKLKYNDSIDKIKPLEIKGLFSNSVFCGFDDFKVYMEEFKKHKIKFFMNASKDKLYEEYLYILNENKIKFTFVNNQEVNQLLNYDIEDKDLITNKNNVDILMEKINSANSRLGSLFTNILKEIETEESLHFE
jgi:hypothetical protein